MAQLNPVNPALAQVIGAMDVIKPVTPEGTPTVASQVMQAAQQAMSPQPMMPSVQDIVQDAGVGGEIQAQQQQAQQQEIMRMMQQMMQQRQGQDNAMRFGVAAAPGAETVRMADGGIVGYAAGNPGPHPLDDPETLRRIQEELARRRRSEAARAAFSGSAPEAAAAAEAASGRGVSSLMRSAGRLGGRALGPLGALGSILAFGIPTRGGEATVGGSAERPSAGDEAPASLPAQASYSNEGRTYPAGSEMRSGIGEIAAAATAGDENIEIPPRAAPPSGSGLMQLAAPQAPMGPSMADKYAGDIQSMLSQYEVGGPQAADVKRRITENAEITNAALRAAGLKPDQRALDEAESQARQTRREEGIAGLRRASEEARSGMNRTIALLSAAANSSNPLAMIGARHGQLVAQDLAENERFVNSLERIRTEGEVERVALREKARAEVIGDVKTARDMEAKIVEARNKRREAAIGAATEFYKAERASEEKALDRQATFAVENLRAAVQQQVNQATKEGTLELRRGNILRQLESDIQRATKDINRAYSDQVRNLNILDPSKPTAEQQRTLNQLVAERDAAIAKIERDMGAVRTQVMGGAGLSSIKVEPIKPSK
jgi:hypothetical protein